jgi:3-deoxy-D-manno-octulosonic-acid transferase
VTAIEDVYTAGLHVAAALLPLGSFGDGKLARGIRGRSGSLERLTTWARSNRDPDRPLAWFHAPSVGEGLQARAVMGELCRLRPDTQIVYTFFSPSAEPLAKTLDADVADYLPLDLPRLMGALVSALQPHAIAFSKTEVWPNLTREAHLRGIPMVLLSATLPATSSRLGRGARALLSPAHGRLTHIAAIAGADGQRFQSLGVPAEKISVMGDARFDQVWSRAKPSKRIEFLQRLVAPDQNVIVAGSTWPPDEEVLVSAVARLTRKIERLKLIIAPHEPAESHLKALEERLRAAGLSTVRYSEASLHGSAQQVVVVDKVGVLGDLYALSKVAFVGGGFGGAGLHSVLEPAAFGSPVTFGPHYSNAREAAELIAAGGARSVESEKELEKVLEDWVADGRARDLAGRRAQDYVRKGLGAARRGAELVAGLIEDRSR